MNRNGKKKMKRGLGVAYCTLIYLFLFLPIAVVAANSFNASTTKPYLSWKGFTLDWYVRLFDNGSLLEAFGNTMLIAAASTVLSTVIGTLGRWECTGTNSGGRRPLTRCFIFRW